jgi:hypothetical protein
VKRVTAAVGRSELRLAELVAALSLGIDLGFGQPMEHVLRQCLIAPRLADLAGLDDDARAAVYYAALLVNVGCDIRGQRLPPPSSHNRSSSFLPSFLQPPPSSGMEKTP